MERPAKRTWEDEPEELGEETKNHECLRRDRKRFLLVVVLGTAAIMAIVSCGVLKAIGF